MEFKDYYKILGIARTANEKEIKAAYRKLARKHHPDVNRNDKKSEARFKEINEANEVLSDPEKRQRYDQLGPDWNANVPPPGAWPGGAGGGRVHVSAEDLGGFSDFFRTIFGGAGGPGAGGFRTNMGAPQSADFEDRLGRGGRRAAEPTHTIDLTLEEVANGTTRRLRLEAGDGTAPREIEVKIPAGVREGAKIRVAGAAGQQDLYLLVHIVPHSRFERVDDDLRATVTVPLTTAVLGGEVEVPTLDGRVSIKVPPATPAGRTFRVRGQGLPTRDGKRGDLLASLSIELPKTLDKRAQELFEELRGLGH